MCANDIKILVPKDDFICYFLILYFFTSFNIANESHA